MIRSLLTVATTVFALSLERIVVGAADVSVRPYADTDAQLPAAALAGFPDLASIMQDSKVN